MKQEKKIKKQEKFEKDYFKGWLKIIKADKNINDTFKGGIK